MHLVAGLFLLSFVAGPFGGEDVLGIGVNGEVHRIDPLTGQTTFLFSAGSCQASARDGMGHLYVARTNFPSFDLFRVDPRSRMVVRVATLAGGGSVLGLAFGDDERLYAVCADEPRDTLFRFDVVRQTGEFVHAIGSGIVQSLAFDDGKLYSYDLHFNMSGGLIVLDAASGAQLSNPPGFGLVDVQGLAFDSSGRLFGGQLAFMELDRVTGDVLSSVPIQGAAPAPFGVDFRSFEFQSSTLIELGFETEDDFLTPLVDGEGVTPDHFGNLVRISGAGPNAGPAVFDSTPGGPNDPSQDPDLLVGLGHVLVLQNSAVTTQTTPGIFDRPNDDQDGGTLAFDFLQNVEPVSIDLVDFDSGASQPSVVRLVDVFGRDRLYSVPGGWTTDRIADRPPGFWALDLRAVQAQEGFQSSTTVQQDVDFDPRRVRRIEVVLGGSGAVDNLRFEPGAAPYGTARTPRRVR